MQGGVLIVGAGQGGAECAVALRRVGFGGEIVLVGEEPLAPYQRPPLSKDFLAGSLSAERLVFRTADAYSKLGVNLLSGCRIASVDVVSRVARSDAGREFSYGWLVIATGAGARILDVPGRGLGNVFSLRSVSDAERLRAVLGAERRLVIVGAGYLGLEVAATARKAGCSVTVVEASGNVLSRSASPLLAQALACRHESEGVEIILNSGVAELRGAGGKVESVVLCDGREIVADAVLIAIGSVPEVSLAREAGLSVGDGILADVNCLTSDANIFAIGDCASWDEGAGPIRMESVQAAIRGAGRVASVISGNISKASRPPYFWSTQYDLRIQIAGFPAGSETHDELTGDSEAGQFFVSRYRKDELVALEAVNMPQAYLAALKAMQKAG